MYSRVSLLCIEGTNLSLTSSYQCAPHPSLEVFSVIHVLLSCALKRGWALCDIHVQQLGLHGLRGPFQP